MKEKPYTELTKLTSMNNKLQEGYILNLYIDMILSEIVLKAEKEKLLIRIDQAIDERNQEHFHVLAQQYKELSKRFGT